MFRSYADILTDLAKPLPPECVTKLKKGGTTIDYLHWYLVATVLDTYAPGWTSEPVEIRDMSGKILVKMRLTIHAKEGEFSQYATGCEEEGGDGYGDAFTNACATALKRAAVLHGVGRNLYDTDQVLMKFQRSLGKQTASALPTPAAPPAPPKEKPAKGSKVLARFDAERKTWARPDAEPTDPNMLAATMADVAREIFSPPKAKQEKPTPPKTRPDADHPQDRGDDWHDLYTQLSDMCGENSFNMARVTVWLRKAYGKNAKDWSTRDLSKGELNEAITQVGARNFSDEQIRFLQAMPEPELEPADAVAASVSE